MAACRGARGPLLAAACLWPWASAVLLGQPDGRLLLSQPSIKGDNECECLQWHKVYSEGLAECGDAMEAGTSLSQGMAKKEAKQYDKGCSVYTRLKANFCMKARQGAHIYGPQEGKYDFTWCYVSPQCKKLGGGQKVNNKVNWKTCVEGTDKRYADLHPMTLMAHIEAAGLARDPGAVALMSYPYVRAYWDQVSSFFIKGPTTTAVKLNRQVREGLQEIVDSGKPMMICYNLHTPGNGRPDACGAPFSFFVIAGKEVWYFPHFRQPVCVSGCGTKFSREALVSYNEYGEREDLHPRSANFVPSSA